MQGAPNLEIDWLPMENQQGSWYNCFVEELTQRQKDIIVGTILGDGYLEVQGKTARLQLKQSEKKKEYVFWLYQELQNLCKSEPKQRKDNQQWYVSTRYRQDLFRLRQKFYRNGAKIIPREINQMLRSPLSVAVWFMDDGTLDWRLKNHYAFLLTTNCFTNEDNQRLVEILKKNFGVDAAVHLAFSRRRRYPRIYIGAKGRDRFYKIVQPFILSCFRYKLPPHAIILNPSETQSVLAG